MYVVMEPFPELPQPGQIQPTQQADLIDPFALTHEGGGDAVPYVHFRISYLACFSTKPRLDQVVVGERGPESSPIGGYQVRSQQQHCQWLIRVRDLVGALPRSSGVNPVYTHNLIKEANSAVLGKQDPQRHVTERTLKIPGGQVRNESIAKRCPRRWEYQTSKLIMSSSP